MHWQSQWHPVLLASTVALNPRLALDRVDLPFGEFDPQLEHFRTAYVEHVAGDVRFSVFPDNEAVGKGRGFCDF